MIGTKTMVLFETTKAQTIQNIIENLIKRTNVRVNPSRSELTNQDGEQLQTKLGWIPMDIMEATIKKNSTCRDHIRLPLRRHFELR